MAKKVQPLNINGVEFDATIDVGRSLPNSVPSYPVEDGFSVSDTIIHSPETLSVTAFLTEAAVDHRDKGHGGAGWVDKVIKQLEALYFSSEPCTVKTPDATYTEMAILDIDISIEDDNGYAKNVAINFQKIETVSSRTTTIPDSYGKSGSTGTNAGTASTSVSSTPTGNNSSSSSGSSQGDGNDGNKSHASTAYNLGKVFGVLE